MIGKPRKASSGQRTNDQLSLKRLLIAHQYAMVLQGVPLLVHTPTAVLQLSVVAEQ